MTDAKPRMDANAANKIIYADLSYQITGICFAVHKNLDRFCREKQYADEAEKYFKASGLSYQRESELVIGPKGNRPDFIVENKIIVDLKAKNFITKEDYNQMQRYLKSANLKLGLIVNFRDAHLKPKRVLNSEVEISHHSHVHSRNSHR